MFDTRLFKKFFNIGSTRGETVPVNDANNSFDVAQFGQDFDAAIHKVFIPSGAPEYCPEFWNDNSEEHNCYNYALRLSEHGRTAPGSLLHKEPDWGDDKDITSKKISKQLLADGLERIRKHECDNLKNHIIAAYLSKRDDYHFYSLDKDGLWSHKNSVSFVEKIEEPNVTFNGLKTKRHNKFLGYYCVPPTGIAYYPRLNPISL